MHRPCLEEDGSSAPKRRDNQTTGLKRKVYKRLGENAEPVLWLSESKKYKPCHRHEEGCNGNFSPNDIHDDNPQHDNCAEEKTAGESDRKLGTEAWTATCSIIP
ncbi:hypothetical protein HHI36_009103 [Cryptolaemus montrouzieri]|uniref:Uncharacterized protein n=1 Tax=Cryptolaemus montrouzieri TaxID=559131 RepID=A0ABD2MUR7_9CUCU